MLALNPQLLKTLTDGHLIAALEAEGPLTPAEVELTRRLDAVSRELERSERQERLRNALISEILEVPLDELSPARLGTIIEAAFENDMEGI